MTTEGANFLFVIDTNQYAGNFEREMTAYLTGRVGDCGVGQEYAAIFNKEIINADEAFENVSDVYDEYGCARPATIWPNPRYANNGMGGHYLVEGANQKALCAKYVEAVENYANLDGKYKFLERIKNGENVGEGWTVAAAMREIKQAEEDIKKAKSLSKVAAFPAYMSVGIWFDTKPTTWQIAIMKERAGQFAAVKRSLATYDKNFDFIIEGFRIIKFEKKQTEELI